MRLHVEMKIVAVTQEGSTTTTTTKTKTTTTTTITFRDEKQNSSETNEQQV